MKRVLVLLSTAILFSAAAGCSSGIGQQNNIPAEVIAVTDSYIIERTGEEFFRTNIKLDNGKSTGDSAYYNVIYNLRIAGKDFIDEEIRFTIGADGVILNTPVAGVPDCREDSSLCDFRINESEAKRIAQDNGLSKGKKEWKTEFTWQGEYSRYVWKITSTDNESQGSHGFRGNGEVIIIDSSSGAVLDKSEWFIR